MSTMSQLSTDGAGTATGAGAEEVVRRFNVAWGAHDLPAALALISEDCVFESTSPPDGQRYTGREAISAAWRPIFADRASQFTVEDSVSAGGHVIQRWRYDWDGGHVRGIDVFTVQNGLVTGKAAYVKG